MKKSGASQASEASGKPRADALRVDKWLHHARVFKTRVLSSQACEKSNVLIGGQAVKSSRLVRAGDVLQVKKGVLTQTLRVLGCPPQRVGPPRVPEFLEDLTTPEEYQRATAIRREEALIHPRPHEETAKPNKQQMRQLREWLENADGAG
jgi:ribosome-associated heat shock protein Hsp15